MIRLKQSWWNRNGIGFDGVRVFLGFIYINAKQSVYL